MICLDTNVVITVLNGRNPRVETRMRDALDSGMELALPVICLFELRYGYARSDRQARMEALLAEFLSPGIAVLPFLEADASHAGEIRAHLERIGQPMGLCDCLIAGQARSRGLQLVTSNTREFDRVPGLDVTDWAA